MLVLGVVSAWLGGSVAVVALCRAAASGDRTVGEAIRADRARLRSHEQPLAA